MTFPWDPPLPAVIEPAPIAQPLEPFQALQRDVAYMVTHTAIKVHSPHPELQILVNTVRGQIVPRNECKFTDGTGFELQDIGMPQPGDVPAMSVRELLARIWEVARELGLELA